MELLGTAVGQVLVTVLVLINARAFFFETRHDKPKTIKRKMVADSTLL
jgi:hypothetical protein